MDFAPLYAGVKENPLAVLLVLSVLALGWTVKELLRRADVHKTDMQAAQAAHLATALTVAPLASKLAESVALVARLSSPRDGGSQ